MLKDKNFVLMSGWARSGASLTCSMLNAHSEVCFSVGLGKEMAPGSVVGCGGHIKTTWVFTRFHFVSYISKQMIFN